MTSSVIVGAIIFTEVQDDSFEPTDEDIKEFAKRIGINLEEESHLIYLAREGLQTKLPEPWRPCLEQSRNLWFYYNQKTHESQWDHPIDSVYRDKVVQARSVATTSDLAIAMNRIQTFDPTIMRPPKSLPPIKKSGASRTSMNSAVGSSLGRLGSFGSSASDLHDSLSINPPQNNEFKSQANNNNSLGKLGNSKKKNIISSSPLNSLKDTTFEDDDDTPPLPRPAKKSGLTLTGGGASFIKGSDGPSGPPKRKEGRAFVKRDSKKETTPDTEDTGGGGDQDNKRPIKSILVNSISRSRPSNSTDNDNDLDGFAMNLDEMTEEEKMVFSQIDSSVTSRSKGNVKFNLDENTELKFELSGDENELHDMEVDAETRDNEDESLQNIPPSIVSDNVDQIQSEPSLKVSNSAESKSSHPTTYSNLDAASMKTEMRRDLDEELKRFRDELENERKKKQEEIQLHFESTVTQFKLEKEETLAQIKLDMQGNKKIEIGKAKHELDIVLQKELNELQINFDDQLAKKKKILEERHNENIEQLTMEYRQREENKISEVFDEKKLEEVRKEAEMELKRQKESLRQEHKRQIMQLKDYHNTIIGKIKAELLEEEQKIRQEHMLKQAEIVAKFEQETQDLKKQLVREQEEALRKVQNEFEEKRETLEKSLNMTLQVVKDRVLQSQNSPVERNESDPRPEEELMYEMKEKYRELEKKYISMKHEMERHAQEMSAKKTTPSKWAEKKSVTNSRSKANEGNSSFEVSDTNQDSAHGSETNSSPYHSSDVDDKPSKFFFARANKVDKHNTFEINRINAALQSLEALRQEILDLRASKTTRSKSSSPEKKKVMDHSRIKKGSKQVDTESGTFPSRRKSGKSSKSKNEPAFPSPPTHDIIDLPHQLSRSVSIPVDVSGGSQSDPISDYTHQKIVDEAKAFIRMQKKRSDISPEIQVLPGSLRPSTKKYLLDNKLLKSIRLAESVPAELNGSETESSGVSSLKDHRSSESKRLTKELDDICSSLNNIDKQMNLIWSVVKGKNQQQHKHDQASSLAFLNATTNTDFTAALIPLYRGKSTKASSSLPTTGRKSFESHQLHQPSASGSGQSALPTGASGAISNYSSLFPNNATQASTSNQVVLDSLRMSGLIPTRLDCTDLLKSLDNELKEFKATRQRLLEIQKGRSSKASVSLPVSARKPFVVPPKQVYQNLTPSTIKITNDLNGPVTSAGEVNSGINCKSYSSLLSNSQSPSSQIVSDALRMGGLSPKRIDCTDLLKSLEDELKVSSFFNKKVN